MARDRRKEDTGTPACSAGQAAGRARPLVAVLPGPRNGAQDAGGGGGGGSSGGAHVVFFFDVVRGAAALFEVRAQAGRQVHTCQGRGGGGGDLVRRAVRGGTWGGGRGCQVLELPGA